MSPYFVYTMGQTKYGDLFSGAVTNLFPFYGSALFSSNTSKLAIGYVIYWKKDCDSDFAASCCRKQLTKSQQFPQPQRMAALQSFDSHFNFSNVKALSIVMCLCFTRTSFEPLVLYGLGPW